jgi:dTDP-4-dehydrorhamnose 3,5-epimerase
VNIERLAIPEVFLLVSTVHGDARGSFSETFRAEVMAAAGATRPFVQENLARTSNAGQLRGLHFQRDPHAQEKLVGVLSGAIFDVAVDMRPGSPTLGRWVGAKLTADDPRQIFVPRGFAHGYLTLTDDCTVLYKTGDYYAPQSECGLRWDDPAIGIDWPFPAAQIATNPRDAAWPPFAEVIASLAG